MFRPDIFSLLAVSVLSVVVFFFVPYGLSPDESHYWLWSYDLDWSYYSKGPLTAAVIWCSRNIFGDTPFAVRLPALLFSLGSFFLFLNLIRIQLDKAARSDTHVALLFLLSASVPGFWYPVFFMTTDAPTIFFWMLTISFVHTYFRKEVSGERNFVILIMIGSAIGPGIWSKYTSFILLGSVCLTLLLKPDSCKRKCTGILTVCFSCGLFLLPILLWNISHDWVNFSHNISHASKGVSKGINLLFVGDFLGAQIGLLGLFFPLMFYYLVGTFKSKRDNFNTFLFITTLSMFGLCFIVSFTKRIYPNWTIPAYFSLFLLMLPAILNFYKNFPKTARTMIAVNTFATILSILLLMGVTWGLPGKILPTKKLVGWSELIEEIQLNRIDSYDSSKNLLVMTESYGLASQFAFLTREREAVYCIPAGGRRMNQFDVWNETRGFSHLKGEDVLLVLSPGVDVGELNPWFDVIERHPLRDSFYYEYNSSRVREVEFFIGKNFSGKQFVSPETF